jgi:hypothetical protein
MGAAGEGERRSTGNGEAGRAWALTGDVDVLELAEHLVRRDDLRLLLLGLLFGFLLLLISGIRRHGRREERDETVGVTSGVRGGRTDLAA